MCPPRPSLLHVFQPAVTGVPVYVSRLARGLAGRGWRIAVAMPTDAIVRGEIEAAGIPVYPLDMARLPSPAGDVRAVRRIRHIVARENIGLIHAHSTKAGQVCAAAGALCRIPSVYTPNGWSFEVQGPLPLRLAAAGIEAALARGLHARVLAVADRERAVAEHWRVLPRGGRCSVVHTGVDPDTKGKNRATARRTLGLPVEVPVVAWVGRASAQKRPQDLAPIASALHEFGGQVVALGIGLRASAAGAALEHAGGRVIDETADPDDLYAAADILLQTSEWEGFPLVLLEGMRFGLPAVVYGVGGVPELVRNGENGFVSAPRDRADAVRHCIKLIQDASLRTKMGARAAATVNDSFSLNAMLEGVEGVYEEVSAAIATPAESSRRARNLSR